MKIMRFPDVAEATGLSRPSIWRLERKGDFPGRVQLGGNAVGWLSEEVEEWIESRPRVDRRQAVETA